jgi:hypothetical protein
MAVPRAAPVHAAKQLISAVLVLAFCASSHAAQSEAQHNVRLNWGRSSETDLTTAIWGDYEQSPEGNYMIGGSWGTKLTNHMFGLPIELTGNVGLQWFNERGLQEDNGYGINTYIKAHYSLRLPFTQKHVRFGLGEGVSYVTQIPVSEERNFAKKKPGNHSEKLLNYVEWTIDVPLRQFGPMDNLISKKIDEVYCGFFIFHRSSVFGVFADTKGGVNFMGFGFEARY